MSHYYSFDVVVNAIFVILDVFLVEVKTVNLTI